MSVEGEWERVEPDSGVPMGDVLTVEGGNWHITGFPEMEGSVVTEGDTVRFVIEKVGQQTREEAIATPGAKDVEARLASLDKQLQFRLESQDGKTFLVQKNKGGEFAEWRFRRKAG